MKVKDLEYFIFCKIDIVFIVSKVPLEVKDLYSGYFDGVPQDLLNRDVKYLIGSYKDDAIIQICVEK